MRQSTVTTKLSRNQNLSGCTFTFTPVLKISLSQNRFFFWKADGKIPEVCDFLSITRYSKKKKEKKMRLSA